MTALMILAPSMNGTSMECKGGHLSKVSEQIGRTHSLLMKNFKTHGADCHFIVKTMTQGIRLHAVCTAEWSLVFNSDPIPHPALQIVRVYV